VPKHQITHQTTVSDPHEATPDTGTRVLCMVYTQAGEAVTLADIRVIADLLAALPVHGKPAAHDLATECKSAACTGCRPPREAARVSRRRTASRPACLRSAAVHVATTPAVHPTQEWSAEVHADSSCSLPRACPRNGERSHGSRSPKVHGQSPYAVLQLGV